MELDQTLIEDIESEELDFRYSITSYGADYPVDSIVKRITDEIIYVPPFQRKFVWNIAQASKFVESLILGLPVPGVFLSRENSTGRMLIVDGQQRLTTLHAFYSGIFKGKEFKLSGLQSNLNGQTYKSLDSGDRIRLDDSIIHATIIRQDEPDDQESSIYLIFERLNTGGKPLTAQEIRACIYYGDFNELLNSLTELPEWRDVFGKENERLKEQELILRFFALYYFRDSYQKPLKGFLNRFMAVNRNFEIVKQEDLSTLFHRTISVFSETFKNKAFRAGRPFNAAVFDSMMIGLAERLKIDSDINIDKFRNGYQSLIENPDYLFLTKGGTSDESIVQKRLDMATEVFSKI